MANSFLRYNNNGYSAYIKNKRIPSENVGYLIPLLFSPNNISESITANYDQQTIPGRSSPVITYSSTGARQVSINISVTPDYLPSGYSSVEEYLRALKALEFPTYSNGSITAPNCYLKLPNLDLDGVCTSVNIEYKTDRITTNKSMAADVSLQFLEVETTVKGAVYVVQDRGGMYSYSTNEIKKQSIEEFTEDISTKLRLNGPGMYSNMTDALYYDLSYTTLNDANTGESLTKEIMDFSTASVVSTVKLDVICQTDNKVIYSLANVKGVSSSKAKEILSECKDHFECYSSHIGKKGAMYTLVYTPKDRNGYVYEDYICKRYIYVRRMS